MRHQAQLAQVFVPRLNLIEWSYTEHNRRILEPHQLAWTTLPRLTGRLHMYFVQALLHTVRELNIGCGPGQYQARYVLSHSMEWYST